jgi:competence protein ComEC
MQMTSPDRDPVFPRSVLPACVIVLVTFCVLGAGCLQAFSIPFLTNTSQPHYGENNGDLSIYFFDVGQGDSSLLTFNNKTILIDAGDVDMGDRVVANLHAVNVTHIDLLVATHPHADHIGGMQKVLDNFPVGQVLDSGIPHPSPVYENFLSTVERKHIPYRVASQGQTIDLDPRLRILVLSPPEKRIGDDLNANSIVLRISYGTINFLFNGDASADTEDALIRSGYPLDAEILKVGHHGSQYSSSPAFIDRVHPEIAVISVGKDNSYGHPNKQTLDTLAGDGAIVYRTDRDGTIRVRSDGASYSVKTNPLPGDYGSALVTSAKSLLQFPDLRNATLDDVTLPEITGKINLTFPVVPDNVTLPAIAVSLPQIGNASSVHITATHFNAPGDDLTNLNGEWVQVTNEGTRPVLLAGWTLSDRNGTFSYTFPAFVAMPGSPITIYTGSGRMNDTALFMGRNSPVWGNTGDSATLKDGNGKIVDTRSAGAGA